MYNITSSILTNLFRSYITKRFMYIFFDTKKVNKIAELSAYLFFCLFTTSAYFIFQFPPVTFFSNVFGLYIISLVYHSSQKKNILIISIIYIINMACDMLSVFLISDNIMWKNQNINPAFITLILFSICELLAERIIRIQKKYFSEMKHWKTLIIIPLCSVLILSILLANKENSRSLTIIMSIGILIINMIVFYLYNALINSYLLMEENAIFKQQTEIYSNQLDVLMQSNNKIRSLQHDMKNHMIQLSIIAKKEEAHNVLEYIFYMSEFVVNSEEYVHSGNKDIDSILNYMIHNAKCRSIEVTFKVTIPENIIIKAFDLNVILGNLLDNAMEALENEKDKLLDIVLLYEKGILYIDIVNTCTRAIKLKNKKFLTTKKDKENHGIGLSNVRRIIEAYNGSIDINHKDNFFIVEIMLYLTQLT